MNLQKIAILLLILAVLPSNILVVLSADGFPATSHPKVSPKEWNNQTFEEIVEFTVSPAIPPAGTLMPEKNQNINVTVRIRNYTTMLDSAVINITSALYWDGRKIPNMNPGIFSFRRIDDYSGYCIINNAKYFPAGSQVWWRIEVTNYTSTPSTLVSNIYYYKVQGAWPYNNTVEEAFEKCIHVIATPDVINGAAPNAYDSVSITIDSTKSGIKIGTAYMNLTVKEGSQVYKYNNWPFAPEDSFTMKLTSPIPGYLPETVITFYIVAFDDSKDASRSLQSRNYTYTVSKNNTWQYPKFEQNIIIRTSPDVIETPNSTVSAGEPVNVTIISRISNVSIYAAYIEYTLSAEGLEPSTGVDVFERINSTTWYYVIDGLPPGISVKFRIKAYDILLNLTVSKEYNYTVNYTVSTPGGKTLSWFYVVVLNYDRNDRVYKYVKDAEVKIYNETWDCNTRTNVMGFAYPNVTGGTDLQMLYMGNYTVEVTYNGITKTVFYELTNESNKTITFLFNEPDKPPVYAEINMFSENYLPVAISLVVIACITVPISWYFRYRRKKTEEEEKRITV
ncbi:MAG: hypothetical protein N3F63_04325 [Thermoplasmata archaeon]|nr:hypothetical protein [Thermoplasmata archaeon]